MKTIINIKADKEVKAGAQKLARDLGLPLSTVINAYLREFIRNREIHFSLAPRMNPALERFIGRAERDFQEKKDISPVFSSAREMDEYLDSL